MFYTSLYINEYNYMEYYYYYSIGIKGFDIFWPKSYAIYQRKLYIIV